MKLKPMEGSRNVMELPGRGNIVAIASVESQEATRGFDFSMAHLSEVAFWKSSDRHSPEDVVRAVCGTVLYAPDTLIVMESTANGAGNYFHREWLRAINGESDKTPLFVAWWDVPMYRLVVADPEAFIATLDDYELSLWELGCTLEQINWYRHKSKEYPSARAMMAEFPSTPAEAFANSSSNVFAMEHVEKMRLDVKNPVAVGELHGKGDEGADALKGLRFVPDSLGHLIIWEFPATAPHEALEQRYVVGVDIGGVNDASDWSVISVMDCGIDNTAVPRIVAQWRGHIAHDLLAWKCAAIAHWYCRALLVIESNTLETERTDGDPADYILNRLAETYSPLYYRTDMSGMARLPGMHINRATKTALITALIAAVREGAYVERDDTACNELAQYERRNNGSFGARDGCHDDVLMTRALIIGVLPQRRVSHHPLRQNTEYGCESFESYRVNRVIRVAEFLEL